MYTISCNKHFRKIVLSGNLFQNLFGQSGIEMSALPKGFYFVKLSGERINMVVKGGKRMKMENRN